MLLLSLMPVSRINVVFQFVCNFLRCLGLVIITGYAKNNFVQIYESTVVVVFSCEVLGALLWAQLWLLR